MEVSGNDAGFAGGACGDGGVDFAGGGGGAGGFVVDGKAGSVEFARLG